MDAPGVEEQGLEVVLRGRDGGALEGVIGENGANFGNLAAGEYSALVFVDDTTVGVGVAEVTDRQSATLSLALETHAALSGTVTRASDGSVAPDTMIRLAKEGSDSRPIWLSTDAQGAYAARWIEPGDYTATVFAPGAAPLVQSVAIGGEVLLDFVVEEASAQVRGRAVGEDGHAATGGVAFALNEGNSIIGASRVAICGEFEIGLAPGGDAVVHVLVDGNATGSTTIDSVSEGATELGDVSVRGVALAGRLADDESVVGASGILSWWEPDTWFQTAIEIFADLVAPPKSSNHVEATDIPLLPADRCMAASALEASISVWRSMKEQDRRYDQYRSQADLILGMRGEWTARLVEQVCKVVNTGLEWATGFRSLDALRQLPTITRSHRAYLFFRDTSGPILTDAANWQTIRRNLQDAGDLDSMKQEAVEGRAYLWDLKGRIEGAIDGVQALSARPVDVPIPTADFEVLNDYRLKPVGLIATASRLSAEAGAPRLKPAEATALRRRPENRLREECLAARCTP